ncbi:copper transport protein [Scheffersomyces xylosifermentans]|uniref:copper transport protein n=1 Tax=Scheffersomyces xylosifermentans TaxID=1304137 RepID=UPI00315CE1DD
MDFAKRHGMAMTMATDAATEMASATMSGMMSMSTGMASHDHSDMDMDMAPMHMYFTTQFKNYPVLFKSLSASTKAQAFGIFLLLFFIAFLNRGLEFVRNYLEQVVWKNPVYVECHPGETGISAIKSIHSQAPQADAHACCGGEEESDASIGKADSTTSGVRSVQPIEGDHRQERTNQLPLASRVFRDIIRLILCIVPDLFGYSLMLVAMTYTLTYFFAVVIGSGVGRFFFERLSDRMNLKPLNPFGQHC